MPMWGVTKTRPTLEIHPMEFTRARLDEDRRGKDAQATSATIAPQPAVAERGDLNDTYLKAIRAALSDLRDSYVDMLEAPAITQSHTDRLHRLSLELKDLTKPMGYRDIAQAALSLAQLCKTARAMAHPELIKLHIDCLRTLGKEAARSDGDGDSQAAPLLEALKIAVGAALEG